MIFIPLEPFALFVNFFFNLTKAISIYIAV